MPFSIPFQDSLESLSKSHPVISEGEEASLLTSPPLLPPPKTTPTTITHPVNVSDCLSTAEPATSQPVGGMRDNPQKSPKECDTLVTCLTVNIYIFQLHTHLESFSESHSAEQGDGRETIGKIPAPQKSNKTEDQAAANKTPW